MIGKNNDVLLTTELTQKFQDKKIKQDDVKNKYRDLDKKKKLTQEQRIARTEEILGIDLDGME